MLANVVLMLTLSANPGWSAAATPDQCTVNVRWPDASREVLLIEGQTYTARLCVKEPSLTVEGRDGAAIATGASGFYRLGDETVSGPGRVNIYSFGTTMYEIHLRDLKAPGFEKGEIELALYAYGTRLFVNANARRYDGAAPPQPTLSFADGSVGEQAAWMDVSVPDDGDTSRRHAAFAALVGETPGATQALLHQQLNPDGVRFTLDGGVLDGYRPERGFYEITTDYCGPRDFETGLINPNMRYEVAMTVESAFPAEVVCNVRNLYGVLEAAVLTDADGFPLPEQVQVCKNFGGEKEEGREEGDIPYGESYFPLTVAPDAPFTGRVYHLFGNWGTRRLRQLSSIRFFHHYFHASLGPTETFCYVPFEYPRPDDRNYVLADVRGLSGYYWPGQPQHHHVSIVGLMRYKSGGAWVNNLLQDTRIHFTAPNLAVFAFDYLSEDGKVKTSVEIFETPEEDESRAYLRYRMEVLAPVEIDGNSARNLRFLNAGAYIVQTRWPQLAYTAADGQTVVKDVPDDGTWVVEAEALSPDHPFTTAYAHPNGNMCFYVDQFDGRLGGKDVPQFGVSCFGGKEWTEMFLTAPGSIARLEAGDHFDMSGFVMPYGHADVGLHPAERQRQLFKDHPLGIEAIQGEVLGTFPPRVRADARGFAHFRVTNGNSWTPILVEGLPSHKAPMLWERTGQWLFHDQQVQGNDWYQSYRAEDGSNGFVFVVNLRSEMAHEYVVGIAPNATAITQRNGYVTVEGGPMDFVSPVAFEGLDCQPLGDTGLLRCRGDLDAATTVRY